MSIANTQWQRIILINPTKYLGNLLLAGGLMQDFHQYCIAQNKQLLIVLDESFKELVDGAFPENCLLFYPRQQIKNASAMGKIAAYLHCLRAIRRFKADLAFVLEQDSVAHRLTLLSGAKFKLGCSANRHKQGYNQVLAIDYEVRPFERRHRWYSYQEVFKALQMPDTKEGYIRLLPPDLDLSSIPHSGLKPALPQVIIHPGATRQYKMWPIENFIALGKLLQQAGFQPVVIGAGSVDAASCTRITSALNALDQGPTCVNLCNQLSLVQLASFMKTATAMVGNDSGPFHLGAALGLPGCTIYGPTEPEIWGPLSKDSHIIQGDRVCVKACRQPECVKDHQCLLSVSPQQVLQSLMALPGMYQQ